MESKEKKDLKFILLFNKWIDALEDEHSKDMATGLIDILIEDFMFEFDYDPLE